MLSVSVWHHFLAVHKRTRIIFIVTAIGLPVNALGNYAFMFGRLGAPALGLSGAGLSSLIVAGTMLVTLTVYVLRDRRLRRYRLFAGITRPDLQTIRETVHIGTPIGLTNLGAMGVFLFSTVMMGIFGAHAVAAHAVAIRMAGVCYAIPMGLSQAATVRVGHAVGANQPAEATDAMAVGLLWAGIVGCCYLLALTTFAEPIARLVVEGTHTAEIVAQAGAFLIALALIDPISTLGTVAAGVLRGVKDTRVPSAIAIGSHWAVGFSTSCLLAFAAGLQGLGIWIGLAVGCTTAGVAVLTRLAVVWRSTGQPVIRTHFA
jgi:MATE family multidrug resistance protein